MPGYREKKEGTFMVLVILTALGVGGATLFGSLLGFGLHKIPHSWNDGVLGFAAGIMTAAAVVGLILPSTELAGKSGFWMTALGILAGAVFLNAMDRLTPHLHHLSGVDAEEHKNNAGLNKVMLFVMAIAIHNLPEGLAAGVSFGSGDVSGAFTVAAGIMLQNIPEGAVTISPLLLAGVSRKRALVIGLLTGLVEVVGTFIGYFAASLSGSILPFSLAFAGGTMLYVISDEMIPETHSHGYQRLATYAFLIGFTVMIGMDLWLG